MKQNNGYITYEGHIYKITQLTFIFQTLYAVTDLHRVFKATVYSGGNIGDWMPI